MDAHQASRSARPSETERPALPAGLTSAEAQQRRRTFGPNAVADETPPAWQVFLAKLWSPVAWMLEAAIVLQIGVGEYTEASVIGMLLLFNAILGFVQEERSGAALAAIKQRLAPSALARRDGGWTRLPASELVPGDVIRLPLGTLVPADTRIISGPLLVDQSMLTGESVPVDAGAGAAVYAGSFVRRGEALAEVTATGAHTYFGRAAELVRIARAHSTEQAAIFATTRNLVAINGMLAMLMIVYGHALALSSTQLIRLALTALLASIPAALPATFTLSAALGARALARRGVLLTRLSAAQEAAAMDLLCADKTGTLTRNAVEVVTVRVMTGFDRDRVLALAAMASSDADQDPIDAAIRAAAASERASTGRLVRFVPFDPSTRSSEALTLDADGHELRVVKGAFTAIAAIAETPAEARHLLDDLAQQGNRVIAVAVGPPDRLRLAGLIAIADPPRDDSATLVSELREMGVRTVMVTGDSPVTAAAIARQVGIPGALCPPEQLSTQLGDEFGVFARVLPEQKYQLVKALQSRGHVVGMCGDGTNDAPALRQAQIGIAVATATDVAKAAAGMVMTEPGLAGIVFAVREGRVAFGRLMTYTLNMLLKKIEIVLFLASGLAMTGRSIMTPVLMVLMLVTNDFLAMSLTTDHASPAPFPSRWRMRDLTAAALVLGVCKLGFSTAVLVLGTYWFRLDPRELQTLAFVTLVVGAQAVLYVVRERRSLWSSRPSAWVFAATAADIGIASSLALTGTLMFPLRPSLLAILIVAAAGFAVLLDYVKRLTLSGLTLR